MTQAMRQRQRLLDEGGRDEGWLSALEVQMSEAGVAIAAARRRTVALLAGAGIIGDNGVGDNGVGDSGADGGGAFPSADLALEGALETALASQDAVSVQQEYAASLAGRRRLDAEAGRALLGPHRSDLVVVHREKGRPARLCSTGEQKALLIGLVLANARVLARRRDANNSGAPLILLLDEIAAHLDPDRRAALFTILGELGFQVFMTGTDKSLFTAWGGRAQYFEASSGALVETTLT